VWGCGGVGGVGCVGSLLTFDIPQTALVATLDTYDFIMNNYMFCYPKTEHILQTLILWNSEFVTGKHFYIGKYVLEYSETNIFRQKWAGAVQWLTNYLGL
jgi:hypothetical protein